MDKELWKKISDKVTTGKVEPLVEKKVEEATLVEENSVQEMKEVEETPAAIVAPAEVAPAAEEKKEFDKGEFFNFLNSLVEQPVVASAPQQQEQAAPPAKTTPVIAQAQPAVSSQPSDIADEEIAAILTEEGLNPKQLKSVLAKVEERTYQRAVGDVTRDLFPVMQQVAMNVASWSSAATRFRQMNADLEPAMKFVAEQSNKIAGAHPEWAPDKVYEEAGKVTRKAIEYFMQQQSGEKPKKPAFAPTPGGKAPVAKKQPDDANKAFMRNLLKWNEPQSTRV